MQKTIFNKIIVLAYLFFSAASFVPIVCSDQEDTSKIYLSLHFSPNHFEHKKESDSENSFTKKTILIYHKGENYRAHIASPLGTTARITTDRFSHTIPVIITTKIHSRKRGSKVVGLMLPEDAQYAYYTLYYNVDSNCVSYHWRIEKRDFAPTQNILGDAIIIIENPEHIHIQPFEDSFAPSCPISGRCCYGVVILPTIHISQDQSTEIVPFSVVNDIDQCHISR